MRQTFKQGNEMAWSQNEVEEIVADYFHMLLQELSGQSYNKTSHRKLLSKKLNNRSDGSIERKHQNISAIMIELGCPYISGYKPLGNYQALLRDAVEQRISKDTVFDYAALTASSLPAVAPISDSYSGVLVEPPQRIIQAKEKPPGEYMTLRPTKKDYLERESRNASLGLAGEEFVVQYEHYRLAQLGQSALADKVEHVSKTKGDGLGFDVLSFEKNGREKYIEVKTTAFGKETPFFISEGEVGFSKSHQHDYHLYRLFNFRQSPKMFGLTGYVGDHCMLNPIIYICEFSS